MCSEDSQLFLQCHIQNLLLIEYSISSLHSRIKTPSRIDSFEKDLWEERFPAQILAAAEKLTGAASDSEIQEPEVMFSHEAQPGHKCEGKRKIGKNVCHRSH